MEKPELPLTRAGARAWATAYAVTRAGPDAEVSAVHVEGFGDDEVGGGFAFRHGRVVLVALRDGAYGSHLDPGDEAGRRAVVERVWAQARRRHRTLEPHELGAAQQAALSAVRHHARRVAALPPEERPGVGPRELAGAEWLLMTLRSHHRLGSPTEAQALRTLAADDHLLGVPPPAAVHPCPLCRGLAPWSSRYPRAVCRDCGGTTRCTHGRVVGGRNTSFSGGFEALHRDDDTVCEPTTATGEVTVAGWRCRMGEARFGGIVVEAAPQPVATSDLALLAAADDRASLLAEVSGLARAPLPAWAGGPLTDASPAGVELHLLRVTEHLAAESATTWCAAHDEADVDGVRSALLGLVDPALGPAPERLRA